MGIRFPLWYKVPRDALRRKITDCHDQSADWSRNDVEFYWVLFRYRNSQHDLAVGFPTFGHGGDTALLDPGQGLVQAV